MCVYVCVCWGVPWRPGGAGEDTPQRAAGSHRPCTSLGRVTSLRHVTACPHASAVPASLRAPTAAKVRVRVRERVGECVGLQRRARGGVVWGHVAEGGDGAVGDVDGALRAAVHRRRRLLRQHLRVFVRWGGGGGGVGQGVGQAGGGPVAARRPAPQRDGRAWRSAGGGLVTVATPRPRAPALLVGHGVTSLVMVSRPLSRCRVPRHDIPR